MSKRAEGAAAARDDDASPSGKSDDDEGSSGDGEPSSPLEPSEAFKRPRLASDARKPIQTRAREPRPLVWRDTAEESDAPQIAPQRPRRRRLPTQLRAQWRDQLRDNLYHKYNSTPQFADACKSSSARVKRS